jgi:hypothetical protein
MAIGAVFPAAEAPAAFDYLTTRPGKFGKILLEFP